MNIHTDLPAALMRSLAVAPLNRGVAVLIRHGDRHHIPQGEYGDECTLTEHGLARAQLLGASLPGPLSPVANSSPLRRCVQTVQAIAAGAGGTIEPTPDPLLGKPGAFVFDGPQAGPMFLERGTRQVVLDLIAGRELPGIRSCEAGSARLLTGLLASLPAGPALRFHASHDAIVLPFLVWATRGALRGEDWIAPLDGGLVWLDDDGPRVAWNGEVFTPPAREATC